jgi:hypothetical protein
MIAVIVFALLVSVSAAAAQESDAPQVHPAHILQELHRLVEQAQQDPVAQSRQRYLDEQLYALSTQEKRLQAWWEQTLQSLNQARVDAAGNRRQLSEVALSYKAAKEHYRKEHDKLARAKQGFAAMQAETRLGMGVMFPEVTIAQPEVPATVTTTTDIQLDRNELDTLLTALETDFYRSKRESAPSVADQAFEPEREEQ